MTRDRYDAAQAEIIRDLQEQLAAAERKAAECQARYAVLINELAAREAEQLT